MKNKVILLIAASAVVTLSFTFVSVQQDKKSPQKENPQSPYRDGEPIGGFLSEDKL